MKAQNGTRLSKELGDGSKHFKKQIRIASAIVAPLSPKSLQQRKVLIEQFHEKKRNHQLKKAQRDQRLTAKEQGLLISKEHELK
mmetsp:Transcript_35487/g.54287  ORF Transcript_35487/g.54287 Transcript_35487/m.54287 type:complete len:84 (-) Transcript_35487:2538-2789(-)